MTDTPQLPLHMHIQQAVDRYIQTLDGEEPTNVYNLFLEQLERPLLEAMLRHTRGNQSKTAQILGLNRGTLRTKLKTHGLL